MNDAYEGEYLDDQIKESYDDIKNQYFEKLNISMPSEHTQEIRHSQKQEEHTQTEQIPITKPLEIPQEVC